MSLEKEFKNLRTNRKNKNIYIITNIFVEDIRKKNTSVTDSIFK